MEKWSRSGGEGISELIRGSGRKEEWSERRKELSRSGKEGLWKGYRGLERRRKV